MAAIKSTKLLDNWDSRKKKKKSKRDALAELKNKTFDELSKSQKELLFKRMAIYLGFIKDDN